MIVDGRCVSRAYRGISSGLRNGGRCLQVQIIAVRQCFLLHHHVFVFLWSTIKTRSEIYSIEWRVYLLIQLRSNIRFIEFFCYELQLLLQLSYLRLLQCRVVRALNSIMYLLLLDLS